MEFAAAIADTVLGRLASYASQEVCLAWGAQLELTKLTETLTSIDLLLQDAERKQVKNPLITHWLAKLKDVCYDVDDLLDELDYRNLHEEVMVNNHGCVKGKVRHFFSRWNRSLFSFNLGRRVKEIRERLSEIDNDKKQFGLVEMSRIAEEHRVQYTKRETDSLVEASQVIGRDDDKKLILRHLLSDTADICNEENDSVVSILGLGGLGKTTLAKLVYNDSSVEDKFEMKMWVCVSENFDVKSLVCKIISAATNQICQYESLDSIKRRLQDTLRGKKFLLVLDDVWDLECIGLTHEKWLSLKSVLGVGANGSKILVTTRNKSVALLMNSLYIHHLEGLPHKECMSLFVKRAFKKEEDKRYPRLIEIGEDIVNKCGGVPLAVATLGSMLHLNREPDQWASVRDDDMWSIGYDNILPALKLSYDALPQHLKPCFAFCSLFPKDYIYYTDLVVQLWVAQGFLKSCKRSEDLNKMGEDYIRQFCSRSLFQVEEDFNNEMRFKMHDLVHDMAISVAQVEYSTVNKRPSSAYKMVRHVSISKSDFVGEDKLLPDFMFKSTKLRTFLIPEDGVMNQHLVKTCILKFKYMRVLDLSGSPLEKLSSSIGMLFNLRLLNLSFNSEIKKLPDSICNLLNLEYLNLAGCSALEDLPKDIGNLVNLQTLRITTQQSYLPKGISRLTSLQLLYFGGCVNLISLGEEIEFLTSLQTLVISYCNRLESLPPNMRHLTGLNTLVIRKCRQLDLMKTKKGPKDLRLFQIYGSDLEALPPWLEDSVKAMQSIVIGECANLTQLPELLNFTILEKLSIERCSNVLALPQYLHHLTELRELTIINCPELIKSCKRQLEGEDWSKFASEAKITLH